MQQRHFTVFVWIIGAWSMFFVDQLNAQIIASCSETTAQIDLDINNVRARLLTGGDLFWDPVAQNPHYEVPAGSGNMSLFAAALWMGGIDEYGALKVAAQTYRQSGNDFWAGPLNEDGTIEPTVCEDFDRHFEVYGSEITEFLEEVAIAGGELAPVFIPVNIRQWPGRNNPYFNLFDLPPDRDFAPFWDTDGDGNYDPTKGDYPVLDSKVEGVYADQMVWWVFNDIGNQHTETGGDVFALQVRALAYAYASSIESVDNATFYKFQVEAKRWDISDYYFGFWVDVDLGQFYDDYVGCIPEWNTGYVYNGDAVDGDYGEDPPILGVRFLDGLVADNGESLGMTTFRTYNNDFTYTGNPQNALDFYEYLQGLWKDGSPITLPSDPSQTTTLQFPGNPANFDEWSECSESSEPADRRFLMASGPASLRVGEPQEVNIAVYWIRPEGAYPCPDNNYLIEAMEEVDLFSAGIDTDVPKLTTPKASLVILPNPTDGQSYIQYQLPEYVTQAEVKVFNVLGQPVATYAIWGNQGETHLQTADWASGVYFVGIQANGQQLAWQKMEVVH